MAKKVNKWLDKFSEAQNGIEGTMGGLTDIGFDYNGAWGGTMAMGGSLPGAVGFTYARTQSPAPSNGPYAKKTKASAQNGQEMKYYQEGLDWKPKTISKDGKLVDKFQEGGEKTYGTYRLPEVVITGEAPEKGFWEQSIDAYLKENKDAGLLGALGSVVTYPLGLPQQAMMYGLTGKVQKPSEALGVKNSLGAIATDAILDPTNLVGAGVLDDTYKLTSRAGKFLTEETALKNAYKYNPFAFKPNPEAYYRQVGKPAIDDALSTKLIREKGEVVSAESFKNFNQQIKDLLGQGDYANYYEKAKAEALAKQHGPMPYFMKGELFYGNKNIIGGGAKSRGVFQNDKIPLDYLIESNHPSKAFQSSYAYRFSPVDVEEIGGVGVLKPNPSLRNLEDFNLYKKDWLRGYKQIPKKEDGGIIEDPMGQWAHPGEITRIPSNQITMQGVDYPVLGISDTGDTQMMYPNEDYSFEGSSVTEIPMMQKGGAVKDPGYSEPDYVTGTSRRALNKMIGMGNYLTPGNVLNQAADLAELKGYGYGEDSEGPLDAVRHASAAASTAARIPVPKIISDYSPSLDQAIRVAGSNLLGLGYELRNFNPEGFLMDIKNNYKGSLVGSIPGLTDKQRNQMIVNQLTNKQLTVDNPNRKKKENGGWLNKYE